MAPDRPPPADRPAGKKKTDSATPSGGKQDRPDIPKSTKGSNEYTPGALKGGGDTNWKTERGKHTKNAEKKGRAEVKSATGKEVKIAGDKVQHHHHADVSEAKRVGLNPKVAGEAERMTAVHSRRDSKAYGTVGDNADASKNKRHTHHNTAKSIDKAEQTRTAKALGQTGDSPKLPKGPQGRAGLTDASATSKWRLPATADQTERAKQKWDRKEPKAGAAGAEKGAAKGAAGAEKGAAGAEKSWRSSVGKASAESAPKPKGKFEVPKGGGKAFEMAGKVSKGMGVVGDVLNVVSDLKHDVIRHRPELLPEGHQFPLYRFKPEFPLWREPSGYTVENAPDRIIYRDPNGDEVSRDTALRNAPESQYDDPDAGKLM